MTAMDDTVTITVSAESLMGIPDTVLAKKTAYFPIAFGLALKIVT